MATYPNRPPFFAHKFCRLLTKSAIAQEVGADTCWLLTVIAHQEDAKRYSGAVTYYNMQLAALCGVESEARLIRIRQRAMDAGLLFYEPGAKRRPGVYWCIVSDALAAIADGPMDESTDEIHFQNGSESWDSLRIPLRSASESEGKAEGKRRESAPPSSLTLIPNPAPAAQARAQPAKRFIKPTLQEVSAYCLERKNDVDPERFHAFYEANGWVQGKGKPLKVWRLDRLSRKMRDGINVLCEWCDRGLRVVSVTQQIDLSGTVGKTIAAVLLGMGEMEQETRRERQAAGIAAAKERGEYRGRRPGSTKGRPETARRMRGQGLSVAEIGRAMGVSGMTVRRYLNKIAGG